MRAALCHARAGSGHLKAAEALAGAFAAYAPSIETSLIDAVGAARGFFAGSYTRVYDWFVHHAPDAWGVLHDVTNVKPLARLARPFRTACNLFAAKPFLEQALASPYEVWIATHFFAANVLAALRCSGRLSGRLVTVVTDFRVHAFWVNPGTDAYVVMHEEGARDLTRWGVGDAEVLPVGIPVHPTFLTPAPRDPLYREWGLEAGRLTVMLSSGTFGTGPLAEIIRGADELRGVQFLVVCGRNERVYQAMTRAAAGLRSPAKIFAFTDRMPDLLSIADIAIVKPGGLTSSECLACTVPMILIHPIPGQERGNADFLERHGVALEAGTAAEAVLILRDWTENATAREAMKRAAQAVAKPRAGEDIVRWVLSHA